MVVLIAVFLIGFCIFFFVGNKKKKENAKSGNQQLTTKPSINSDNKKKTKQKLYVPKTSSQVIHMFFKEYDEKTGLFKIDDDTYSVCYEFSDISFSKANQETQNSIFLKYVDFINSLPVNIHLQVIHCGVPVASTVFKEDFIFPIKDGMTNNEKRLATEFNEAIENNLGSSQTTFCETRLLVLSISASSFDSAYDILYQYQLDVEEKFLELKSSIHKWSVEDRLRLIYNTFNLVPFTLKYTNNERIIDLAKNEKVSVFDFIAPKENIDPREQNYIIVGDSDDNKKIIKVMYVKKFPTSITPAFYNKLTTSVEGNVIVTENISPTDTAKMVKRLEKKISGLKTERFDKIKKNAKSNVAYEFVADEQLDEKIANYTALRKALVKKKQKLFKKNILVCAIASDFDELQKIENQIKSIAGEYLVEVANLNWQQFEGLQNLLPMGFNSLQFQRSLHSEAVAESVPFNSKSLLQPKALFYGVDLISKKLVCCDRKLLMNGNGCVLATSGAGKSFFVKSNIEQIDLRYPKDEIVVLDPQGEYAPVINALGGQIIEISTTASTYINPFDMELQYVDEDNDPIKTKTEYILAFIESIVGGSGLTGEQKSIIDRATKRIYENYELNHIERNKPSFPVFYKELQTYGEVEAKNLVLVLERYVQGGMDIFSKDTNIEINNKIICFDLHNLTASMQNTGYLVVLEHIMNRAVRNKQIGINSWLFVDEFHILLANTYSAEYIAKIFKIGRKLGVLPTIITQNITDVLNNEQGCKILSNSEFAVILKQKALDLRKICEIFGISPEESKFCYSTAPSGQGVIVYGADVVPFRNQVPKESYIYELNNTDGMQLSRE